MNKIGFQNFRRFVNFPELEYGGITMLVGKNNSGKSTMVKALLLVNDFLKSKEIKTFSFSNNALEDANIVTYSRALNIDAKVNKEDFIKFRYELNEFQIDIEISGDGDKTTVDVHTFTILDTRENIKFEIKPQIETFTVTKLQNKTNDTNTESSVDIEIQKIRELLKGKKIKKSSKEYLELADNLNALIQKRGLNFEQAKYVVAELADGYNQVDEFSLSTYFLDDMNLQEIVEDFISENTSKYLLATRGKNPIDNDVEEFDKNEIENYVGFYQNRSLVEGSFERFNKYISKLNIKYLGANSSKQSALFAIRDKNNSLAQAIHEYKQLGIDKATGSEAYQFVNNWMKAENFDIGEELKIEMHAGEAYEVNIIKDNKKIALADNGMGSIQAMLLILRLACIIHKKTESEKEESLTFRNLGLTKLPDIYRTTVIIEEPELNLHPAMQSKLADLFHDVYEKFEIHLIIETHSEYLIRKTQLIVKEKEYEVKPNENPFTVIYFDTTEGQWKMNYREDGKFSNEFGSGFYDESAILTLNLL